MRLTDSIILQAKRNGNMVIKRNDDKSRIIEDVLFVPEMECNLQSVFHLIEKNLLVIMKNDVIELYNPNYIFVFWSNYKLGE